MPRDGACAPFWSQVRAITEHKYTPDRYLYKEGLALAAKLEAQEKAAAAAGHSLKSPPTPVQQVRALCACVRLLLPPCRGAPPT